MKQMDAIEHILITPNIDLGSIDLELEVPSFEKKKLEVIIKDQNEIIVSDTYLLDKTLKRSIQIWDYKIFETNLHHHGKTWSPENPYLYDIEFRLYKDNILNDNYNKINKNLRRINS